MKEQLGECTRKLSLIEQERDMKLQQVRVVAETERLNLKTEFEVKCDLLAKENDFIKEERKKLIRDGKETNSKFDHELRLAYEKIESLQKELNILSKDERIKDEMYEENKMLKL